MVMSWWNAYCKDGLVFVCPLYWKFCVNNDGLVLCRNAIYSAYDHYIKHYIVRHCVCVYFKCFGNNGPVLLECYLYTQLEYSCSSVVICNV